MKCNNKADAAFVTGSKDALGLNISIEPLVLEVGEFWMDSVPEPDPPPDPDEEE